MKRIFLAISILSCSVIQAQELKQSEVQLDRKGFVKSIVFDSSEAKLSKITKEKFFSSILKKKAEDSYIPDAKIKRSDNHVSTLQYYKGIRVDGAGYNLHFDDNGVLQYVNGKYVDCSDIDVIPSINEQKAVQTFSIFLNLPENIKNEYKTELMIKEIKKDTEKTSPKLVYKTFAISGEVIPDLIGYVDAHTGKVLETENNSSNVAAIFSTYYLGVKYAQTKDYNNGYRLYDDSHPAVIHTRDLSNHAYNQISYATEITDADNSWSASELGDNQYALDVHWALQKIYERLYNTHGKNSFDNLGHSINAYINACYSNGNENAAWIPTLDNLTFGNGVGSNSSGNGPMGTVDIVAHEYGHAITKYQIGWSSGENYLNEGLSDIWAAILEYRIDPNAQKWKIAERRYTYSYNNCLRNLASPTDSTAVKPATDAYNSYIYQNNTDEYVRGGVFSHWFYLLVEGGSGTNSLGTYYYTAPVGMDIAENLIVKAVFDGYLSYTDSYADVRNAFIQAATAMGNSNLVARVKDAWHAVGVGSYDTPIIAGSDYLTGSSGEFYISNLLEGVSVSYYLDTTPSCNPYSSVVLYNNTPTTNHCTVYNFSGVTIARLLFANITHDGHLIKTANKAIKGDGSLFAYFWENTSDPYIIKNLIAEEDNYVTPGSLVYIQSDAFYGRNIYYTSSMGSGYINPSGNLISFDMPYLQSGSAVYFTVSGGGSSTQYNFTLQSNGGNSLNNNSKYQTRLINRQELILYPSKGYNEASALSSVHNCDKEDSYKYEIYNSVTQKKEMQGEFGRDGVTLNVSSLPTGLYIIKIHFGKEKYISKFFLR